VTYSDTDPSARVGETALLQDAETEPKDGMAGAEYVELKLAKLLTES
jgi:hypothetical protein